MNTRIQVTQPPINLTFMMNGKIIFVPSIFIRVCEKTNENIKKKERRRQMKKGRENNRNFLFWDVFF